MTRINIYITDNQKEILREQAELSGITLSEMIRRVLDKHINQAPSTLTSVSGS